MGYDIRLRLRVFPASQYLPIVEAIDERFDHQFEESWFDEDHGTCGEGWLEDARWYELTEDLKELSKDFPEVTIQAFVEGEDRVRWVEWFRNGEHYMYEEPEWDGPEEPVQPERFGNPGMKPYTVIVWYMPEGEIENHNMYTMHVLGTDTDDAANNAIDKLIKDRLGELALYWMDVERIHYKPIAIYDNHINNLIR